MNKCEIGILNYDCVRQNTLLSDQLTWLNDDGTPVDLLTDFSDMKWSFFFDGNQVDLTVGSGITISGPENNVMTFQIAESTTLAATPKRYFHQLLMINSLGDNEYTIEGYIQIVKTETRITS